MANSRVTPSQRKWWIIGGIAIAIACAIATWWGISASKGVTYQQAGFKSIDDNHIQAIWDVGTPGDKKPVTCTLIAMNDRRDVVGQKQVQLKASRYDSTRYHETLLTTSRAVTATVKECHYSDERSPNQ